MELLEQIFEIVSDWFSAIGRTVERGVTAVFGSSNARYLKRVQPLVDAINALEPRYQQMTDAELREQTDKFKQRLAAGERLDDLLVEAYAVCREAGRRVLGMRHFDVQLIGGIVLHRGAIAEMVTGEGKTLVATLAAYLNALEGKGVHVVTVNDYLARRDMEWMGPLYMSLGLTVGTIQSNMSTEERQKAYDCDITYGTNNEFGFDYLRDNMRLAARGDDRYPRELQQVQRGLHYAIVDEVDNILIDEARTPLIISGPAHDDVSRYRRADQIARQLKRDVHFEVNEKEHTVHLTEEGVRRAEQLAGVESFYTAGNMEWPHLIDNALKAHHLYKRDVNYVVQNGEVVIVDEFTGRLMPGRHWSDGLHQAVEAKEGVRIKEENQTLATITLQNFFKLYDKICGMTGTAMTEANEFWKIYNLEVVAIPTNCPLRRINHPDVIFRSEREKYEALVEEIERIHKWDVLVYGRGEEEWGKILKETDEEIEFVPRGSRQKQIVPRSKVMEVQRAGRPILVGTVSIERSELVSRMLEQRGIKHAVLNAKHHQREAEIIAQAGRKGAVTIATNMAGRGTDIILGGNPEAMAWAQLQEKYATRLDVPREEWDALVTEIEKRENMKAEGREVAAMGGLHVIGTERHEARRIDLQLRGRAGRQGDPGSSRFYLSLEDDLMRIFAGEWVKNVLTRMGMQEGQAIESRLVTRRIEGAQKKVEERNFDIRKNLLEYDEVMDEQRKRVYSFRQSVLEGADCKELIMEMIREEIDRHLDKFLDEHYGTDSFAEWASQRLAVELDPRDFRGVDFPTAERYAKDQAERMAESQVLDLIEENLPDDADPREWSWEALAKAVNARWHLNLRDRDLKKVGRERISEYLIEQAYEAVGKVDLSGGAQFLEPDFGLKTVCNWVRQKFGIEMTVDEIRPLDPEGIRQLVFDRADAVYRQKEVEFPVMAGLYHFTTRDASGHKRYDREKLIDWARDRFGVELSLDDVKNKQRHEIQQLLIDRSRRAAEEAQQKLAEGCRRLEQIFSDSSQATASPQEARNNGQLQSLAQWLKQELHCSVPPEELGRMPREELERRVRLAVEERYRPEMRRMERALVLQILDQVWKDHLLVMDHLRSSIGLRGYAQVDPKVEYKREGMRLFENMWHTVHQRVTDLVFRIEQMDERFIGSTWTEAQAIHDEAPAASEIAQQQQAAIDGTQADKKLEPYRRREQRVGRNDPCPCGSGKKYKRCCGRTPAAN
ncbi:MAG TPA: preprotein translocase subunit SecA [Planctomycetes bacterium]|nr:preprotein translocase subunit SecA [Planctomycetota bacterium]